eukprot:52971_1
MTACFYITVNHEDFFSFRINSHFGSILSIAYNLQSYPYKLILMKCLRYKISIVKYVLYNCIFMNTHRKLLQKKIKNAIHTQTITNKLHNNIFSIFQQRCYEYANIFRLS